MLNELFFCRPILAIHALRSVLNSFCVVNRKNMFVYQERTTKSVFYLRLDFHIIIQSWLLSLFLLLQPFSSRIHIIIHGVFQHIHPQIHKHTQYPINPPSHARAVGRLHSTPLNSKVNTEFWVWVFPSVSWKEKSPLRCSQSSNIEDRKSNLLEI